MPGASSGGVCVHPCRGSTDRPFVRRGATHHVLDHVVDRVSNSVPLGQSPRLSDVGRWRGSKLLRRHFLHRGDRRRRVRVRPGQARHRRLDREYQPRSSRVVLLAVVVELVHVRRQFVLLHVAKLASPGRSGSPFVHRGGSGVSAAPSGGHTAAAAATSPALGSPSATALGRLTLARFHSLVLLLLLLLLLLAARDQVLLRLRFGAGNLRRCYRGRSLEPLGLFVGLCLLRRLLLLLLFPAFLASSCALIRAPHARRHIVVSTVVVALSVATQRVHLLYHALDVHLLRRPVIAVLLTVGRILLVDGCCVNGQRIGARFLQQRIFRRFLLQIRFFVLLRHLLLFLFLLFLLHLFLLLLLLLYLFFLQLRLDLHFHRLFLELFRLHRVDRLLLLDLWWFQIYRVVMVMVMLIIGLGARELQLDRGGLITLVLRDVGRLLLRNVDRLSGGWHRRSELHRLGRLRVLRLRVDLQLLLRR